MTQQQLSMNAAQAWSLFWSEQGQNSRCLALSPDFCERLDAHWHSFASTLPKGAAVIDLGCGSGAVGKALRSAEPALRVTGVDAALIAPSREPGLELVGSVAMEALPFPTAGFAAAVSQFGYEYAAAPDAAAREVSRVVAPGGSLSFLIHHDEGPIIAAMRRHRRAIEGLCGPDMRSAFVSGDANLVTELIAALRQECANDPLVEAAGRGLQAQVRNDEAGRARVWSAIVDALSPELVMLHSLDLSGAGGRSIDEVKAPLADAFDLEEAKPVRSAADEPIAWIVHGSRRH